MIAGDNETPKQGPKIIQVVPDLGPASGSLLSALPQLCGLLEDAGCAVDLWCTDERDGPVRRELRNGFKATCFPKGRWGKSLGWSASLNSEVRRMSKRSDVLHVQGVWWLSGVYALEHARRCGMPAIVSPLGAFADAALQMAPVRKRAFWSVFRHRPMRGIACYHVASQREHDQLRAWRLKEPIAVIPLGTDVPGSVLPMRSREEGRVVLFLGRITPIKNLVSLITAWRSIQADFPRDRLRIVGPDDRGHRELVTRATTESGAERVSIEPEIFGPQRDQIYATADVVILPSLSESFGLVVPEALAAGRPAIVTAESPWQVLVDRDCGWCVDPSVEALAGAMREALGLPEQDLAEMGQRGRHLALQEYSWPQSASRFVSLYHWVLGGGPPPSFVST